MGSCCIDCFAVLSAGSQGMAHKESKGYFPVKLYPGYFNSFQLAIVWVLQERRSYPGSQLAGVCFCDYYCSSENNVQEETKKLNCLVSKQNGLFNIHHINYKICFSFRMESFHILPSFLSYMSNEWPLIRFVLRMYLQKF